MAGRLAGYVRRKKDGGRGWFGQNRSPENGNQDAAKIVCFAKPPEKGGGHIMNKISELFQEKGELIESQRKMIDATYDAAGKVIRSFTADEEATYEKMEARLNAVDKEIETHEAHEARARKLAEREALANDGGTREYLEDPSSGGGNSGKSVSIRSLPEYRAMFSSFLRIGDKALANHEARALQVDLDSSGGYLLLPEQFMNEILRDVDDAVVIRGISRVLPPLEQAGSLGVPVVESGADDAEWTTELKTGDEDKAIKFGKRSFEPHFVAKEIKVSKELARRLPTIDAFVRAEFVRVLGATYEKAYMTGNGDKMPLGIFTASDAGIPTSRDMATDNTATALTAEGLINAKYSLKAQYTKNARWVLHRDVIKEIRKLKITDTGDFVWNPGLATDRPDTILDIPIISSEYAPNTMTTKKYVGIIGDFSHYWIVDSLDMDIQFLAELYAKQNLNAYILRAACDGMPTRAEAFTRIKLA